MIIFRSLFFLTLIISSLSLSSQVKIKLNIENHNDSTFYLLKYKNNKTYTLIDSTNTDKNVFKKDVNYPEGIYVVADNKKIPLFEILLGKDQRFSIHVKELADLDSYKVKGSKETSAYFDIYSKTYHNKLYIKALESEMKYFHDNARKIDSIKLKHNEYLESIKVKDDDSFLRTYISFNKEVIIPQEYNDNAEQYTIDHYFDEIWFGDARILNTRLLKNKLDDYFNNYMSKQTPKIICQKIDYLINLINGSKFRVHNSESSIRDYILWYLYSKYFNPENIENELVYIHLIDNYFSRLKIENLTENIRKEMKKRADVLRKITTGNIMPEISFTDDDGDNISLKDVKAKNTIIIFHKTDCALCHKALRILTLIEKRNKDLKIIDIDVTDENAKQDIISRYNITNVPTIYVLDKDKRIITKNIKAEEVEYHLKRR